MNNDVLFWIIAGHNFKKNPVAQMYMLGVFYLIYSIPADIKPLAFFLLFWTVHN